MLCPCYYYYYYYHYYYYYYFYIYYYCSTSGQLAAADGRTNLQEDRSKPLVRSSSADRT